MKNTIMQWYTRSIFLVLTLSVNVASARNRDLNISEARELIKAYLSPAITRLPHFGLDRLERSESPRFYAFEATATIPGPESSPVIGSFAVDRETGAVWQLVVCEEVHSASLARLQNSMRKRINLYPREVQGLAGRAPCSP